MPESDADVIIAATDTQPPVPPEDPGKGPDPAPKLISWPAVVLLCLTPFVFTPFFRQTFPHIGLWPAALIAAASIYLQIRGISRWDRLLAKAGLLLTGLALAAFWVGVMAGRIPGDWPGLQEPASEPSNAWPYKAIQLVVLMISIVFHECAHAIAAYLSGDPTAKDHGRISLSPLRHIDLFGTIILPVVLSLSKLGVVFGWAKPVPVDPARFRHARRGRLAVSLAGVMTNLGLAVFCSCALQVLGILLHLHYPGLASQGFALPGQRVIFTGLPNPLPWQFLAELLKAGIMTNMILFTLNILPVPPLDGFGIVEGLMPNWIRAVLQKARPLGTILFFILIVTNAIDYALYPGLIGAAILNMIAGAAAKLG